MTKFGILAWKEGIVEDDLSDLFFFSDFFVLLSLGKK